MSDRVAREEAAPDEDLDGVDRDADAYNEYAAARLAAELDYQMGVRI